MNTVSHGKCLIGTSGWSYPHWAKGVFYPKGMKQGEWLPFYASHFATVELNASFYRLPKQEVIAGWTNKTSSRFSFAIKLWRQVTHVKRLKDCTAELTSFFELTKGFKRKRGPILIQLPPSLHKDCELLAAFLADFKRIIGRSRVRIALEFRHNSWFDHETYGLLDRYRISLVLEDFKGCPVTKPNDAPFIYLRRHGPTGRYRGLYSEEDLLRDAAQITDWRSQRRDVYVYFNNDFEGYAILNAKRLIELLT